MSAARAEIHARLAWAIPFLGLDLVNSEVSRLAGLAMGDLAEAEPLCPICGKAMDAVDPAPGEVCEECRYAIDEDMDA